MSQSQIKALTQRIVSLEDALTKLQQATVNTVATQIQALFTDPVMVESITHRMLASAANAIAHKAAQSNQRAPELTVLEGYIPGALRAIMNEDGSMTVEQQLKGATNAGGQWESVTEDYQEKGVLETFSQLMASFGVTAGRVYYITDTVTAGTHRTKVAQELAAQVTAVEGADAADGAEDPVVHGICIHLALVSDETKTTSIVLEDASPVKVVRDGTVVSVPAEEIEDGDFVMITEVDQEVAYQVTSTELATLTEALPDGVSDEGLSVRLVTKPFSLVEDGQVELPGDEQVQFVGLNDNYEVVTDAGGVLTAAKDLIAGDKITVSRNGQVVREVVVAAEVAAFTAEAE